MVQAILSVEIVVKYVRAREWTTQSYSQIKYIQNQGREEETSTSLHMCFIFSYHSKLIQSSNHRCYQISETDLDKLNVAFDDSK